MDDLIGKRVRITVKGSLKGLTGMILNRTTDGPGYGTDYMILLDGFPAPFEFNVQEFEVIDEDKSN